MGTLHLQEKHIYQHLQPLFSKYGYTQIAAEQPFRKYGPTGYQSVHFSISGNSEEQLVKIHLGIRLEVVEGIIAPFLHKGEKGEHHTISASPSRIFSLNKPSCFVPAEGSQQEGSKEIATFMKNKGFRFLESFSRLQRIDTAINRKPCTDTPLMPNQFDRCFKAMAIAKLLHRADFDKLVRVYNNYLYSQWASEDLIKRFHKLVQYLRYLSLN